MRSTKDRPVLWFRVVDDRRRPWRAFLTRPDITSLLGVNDDGFEDHGTTDFDGRRVYVNANKPRSTWEATAAHELGHVALDDTGFQGEESEKFVEVHAVRFLPILRSLGFRFPEPPQLPWRKRR